MIKEKKINNTDTIFLNEDQKVAVQYQLNIPLIIFAGPYKFKFFF